MSSCSNNEIIIITGAAGFIGRHCGKELHFLGYKVVGIDRVPFPDCEEWGFLECIEGSINMECLDSLAKIYCIPLAIIHCAGSGSVGYSYEYPEMDFYANVLTMLPVLEFARKFSDSVRVILPSSAAVYGIAQLGALVESGDLEPISPYGYHKRISEELCISYSKIFNIPISIVRLFSVYGIGLKKQLLWDACVRAESGNFIFSGCGEEIRDFIHIYDASKLLIMAISKASMSCPIINGGTGYGVSIKELLTLLGSFWENKQIPLFSGDKRVGDPAHYVADISLLKSWGYKPIISLKDSIKEYVEWFQGLTCND